MRNKRQPKAIVIRPRHHRNGTGATAEGDAHGKPFPSVWRQRQSLCPGEAATKGADR
jgi:hypothetical protein